MNVTFGGRVVACGTSLSRMLKLLDKSAEKIAVKTHLSMLIIPVLFLARYIPEATCIVLNELQVTWNVFLVCFLARTRAKHMQVRCRCSVYIQGRNEVTWSPGQETSLTPTCSNQGSFGSKCILLKKVLLTLLGLFGSPRSHSAPP